MTAKIDLVETDVQDWQGRAAEQFTENFLSPFGQTRLNQIGLTEELITALEGSRRILVESRNSIADIVDKTVMALNDIDTDGGSDWGMALQLSVAGGDGRQLIEALGRPGRSAARRLSRPGAGRSAAARCRRSRGRRTGSSGCPSHK